LANSGKLSKVSKFIDSLVQPLQNSTKTKILDEITKRIGSLSAPSKMPVSAWSISAAKCVTGSKLSQVPGTPCSKCYAQKGRYSFPLVQLAQDRRLKAWQQDPDWVLLMSIRIALLGEGYFRWFDSGDLQSFKMLQDINQIALNLPEIQHWLPTQERKLVKGAVLAPNLLVRVSSTQIDEHQELGWWDWVSSIGSEEWTCPSDKQEGKCGNCRQCWDKSVSNVIYKVH